MAKEAPKKLFPVKRQIDKTSTFKVKREVENLIKNKMATLQTKRSS